MRFSILVTGPLYSSQCAYSAWRFCQAALAGGHSIEQVFFYQDGVTQASGLSLPLADEFDAVSQWAQLAESDDIDLIVCVSAAERRGIINAAQAAEHQSPAYNIHPNFRVEGLGVLHEASLSAERMVTFT